MQEKDIVDNYLLKKFQQFADFIQDWTGVHNFQLAYFLIGIWGIFRSMSIYFETSFLGAFISALFLAYMIFYNKLGFSSWKNNPTFSNILVLDMHFLRIAVRIFTILTLVHFSKIIYLIFSVRFEEKYLVVIFFEMSYFLQFFILYFMSCTPKPPKRSKIKKKILKFQEGIRELGTSLAPKPSFG